MRIIVIGKLARLVGRCYGNSIAASFVAKERLKVRTLNGFTVILPRSKLSFLLFIVCLQGYSIVTQSGYGYS